MGKQSVPKAFKNAFAGIIHCIVYERNMKIHMIATILAGVMAWWLRLNRYELLILVVTVVSVLVAEMMNTVVEAIVDMVSPEIHPLAKIAKDVAAGVVLIAAMTSLLIGYLLFFEKIWHS